MCKSSAPWFAEGTPLAISDDGRLLAVGTVDGSVSVWDRDGRKVATVPLLDGVVKHLRLSPDGRHLVGLEEDPVLRILPLGLDDLLARTCVWTANYLRSEAVPPDSAGLCATP